MSISQNVNQLRKKAAQKRLEEGRADSNDYRLLGISENTRPKTDSQKYGFDPNSRGSQLYAESVANYASTQKGQEDIRQNPNVAKSYLHSINPAATSKYGGLKKVDGKNTTGLFEPGQVDSLLDNHYNKAPEEKSLVDTLFEEMEGLNKKINAKNQPYKPFQPESNSGSLGQSELNLDDPELEFNQEYEKAKIDLEQKVAREKEKMTAALAGMHGSESTAYKVAQRAAEQNINDKYADQFADLDDWLAKSKTSYQSQAQIQQSKIDPVKSMVDAEFQNRFMRYVNQGLDPFQAQAQVKREQEILGKEPEQQGTLDYLNQLFPQVSREQYSQVVETAVDHSGDFEKARNVLKAFGMPAKEINQNMIEILQEDRGFTAEEAQSYVGETNAIAAQKRIQNKVLNGEGDLYESLLYFSPKNWGTQEIADAEKLNWLAQVEAVSNQRAAEAYNAGTDGYKFAEQAMQARRIIESLQVDEAQKEYDFRVFNGSMYRTAKDGTFEKIAGQPSTRGLVSSKNPDTEISRENIVADAYLKTINSGELTINEALTKIGTSKDNAPIKNKLLEKIGEQGGKRVFGKNNESIENIERQIVSLEKLLENDLYKSAVGVFDMNFPTGLSSKKGNAINLFSSVLSSQTLNALANAKSQGITFGALSEKEMSVVSESANNLASSAKRDERTGRIKGFYGDEQSLKDNIDTVIKSLKKSIARKTEKTEKVRNEKGLTNPYEYERNQDGFRKFMKDNPQKWEQFQEKSNEEKQRLYKSFTNERKK